MNKRPFWILPIIIFSQFTGTSLWFASNAILPDLQKLWGFGNEMLSTMTSMVQFGFISGTLCFAFLTISDRYSPRIVFFVCSILGALSNLSIYLIVDGLTSLLFSRFITGFLLAGIYPVGMKIAAGWYQQGLGKALGFLVGALVVGTAFPHLLKGIGASVHWEIIIFLVSGIATLGGFLMLFFVPDGPYLSKGTQFNSRAIVVIFQSKHFRSAAFGYFGHMWELYTFWAFIPLMLTIYATQHSESINISFWSFCIIAVGFFGCSIGGVLSKKVGSETIALFQLTFSGICCLLSPFIFAAPLSVFLGFLIFWGIVVVGDSPQFSTLIAKTAPKDFLGSALTIVNCIGFFITIISIQLTNQLMTWITPDKVFLFLAIGPIIGLVMFWSLFITSYKPSTTKIT